MIWDMTHHCLNLFMLISHMRGNAGDECYLVMGRVTARSNDMSDMCHGFLWGCRKYILLNWSTDCSTVSYNVIWSLASFICINQLSVLHISELAVNQFILSQAHLLVPISGWPCRPRMRPAASPTGSSWRTNTGSPGVHSVSAPGTETPSSRSCLDASKLLSLPCDSVLSVTSNG